MLEDHPAREQVRTPAAELARARSGEHETNAPAAAIGERLNGVEERGYALHLVDDDERAGRQRLDFASQPRRVLGVPEKLCLVGEVDVDLGAEVAADRRLAWRGPSRRTLLLVVARRPTTTLSRIVGYLRR